MQHESPPPGLVVVRHDLRPGDLGAIVNLHGVIYARKRGWDATFEAYVAGPLAEVVRTASLRDRIWIAEQGSRMFGCIAIVRAAMPILNDLPLDRNVAKFVARLTKFTIRGRMSHQEINKKIKFRSTITVPGSMVSAQDNHLHYLWSTLTYVFRNVLKPGITQCGRAI